MFRLDRMGTNRSLDKRTRLSCGISCELKGTRFNVDETNASSPGNGYDKICFVNFICQLSRLIKDSDQSETESYLFGKSEDLSMCDPLEHTCPKVVKVSLEYKSIP